MLIGWCHHSPGFTVGAMRKKKEVYIMSLHEHVYGVCINNVSIHVDSKTVCMQHGVFPSE